MKISTKGRYGVRFLMDLARHNSGNVTLKDISARQDISEKYLWQVVNPLKTAGLIRSASGPHGGYALAKPPESITLREILAVLEGDSNIAPCIQEPSACKRGNACAAHQIWKELDLQIASAMESVTLHQMAEKQRVLTESSFSSNYSI